MVQVAIVGGGELGGSVAHVLAQSDVASTIRLIDRDASVAAGKALDIMQASPLTSFAARVSGSSDFYAAAGSQVIVIADQAATTSSASDARATEDRISIVKDLVRIAPGALLVCASSDHRELIEQAVRRAIVPTSKILGTAPEALASAIRASVALEADLSPSSVSLTVLGIPPAAVVIPWDQATVAGLSLVAALDVPARRRVEARVRPMWPPGPHGLARSAVAAISCFCGRSRQSMSCFVALTDRPIGMAPVIALPIRIGTAGVMSAELPALNTHDRVGLENAVGRSFTPRLDEV